MRQHLAAALIRGSDSMGLLTIRSDRFSLLQNDDQIGANATHLPLLREGHRSAPRYNTQQGVVCQKYPVR